MLTMLAAIVLVLGPIVAQGLPLEISQWHVASAVAKERAGDIDGAKESLNWAIRWSGTNPSIYLARAELSMRQQEYSSALKDYDQSLRFSPNALYVIIRRSEALQHLDRFDEAVEEWEQLVTRYRSTSESSRAMLLNGLAYARALAADSRPPERRDEVDLDQALEEVERAIILDRSSANAAMLDTRGFIRLLRRDLSEAEADLNSAVEGATAELEAFEQAKDYADEHAKEHDRQVYRRALAVMLYHRAMLLEELEQPTEVQADRKRIVELGFDPDNKLF